MAQRFIAGLLNDRFQAFVFSRADARLAGLDDYFRPEAEVCFIN